MAFIRFVTCQSLEGFFYSERFPNLTIDDVILLDALVARGHDVEPLVWCSPEARAPEGDLLLIRSPWDYFERCRAFMAWLTAMENGGFAVANSPSTIRWNLEKYYLRELEENDVPIIPSRFIDAGGTFDLPAMQSQLNSDELVIKPVVSANAYGTYRVKTSNYKAVKSGINGLVQGRDTLVQPFLPEIISEGEWSLVFFNGRYSHGFLKTPGPGDFRVQEEHGGATHVKPAPEAAIDVAEKAVAMLDDTPLYARVDGVRTDSRFLIMEVELFEPELYFRSGDGAAERMADAIEDWLAK